MRDKMQIAFDFVKNKLFSKRTSMIYDHIVTDREHEFPVTADIELVFPNPCGYASGMEDGMISGATMLDVCLMRWEKEKCENSACFAREIVKGMLNCADSAKSSGFLPRCATLDDVKIHYPDSSRDQYTMFAFGMHRYINAELCTHKERERIAKIAVDIARRAERNVTQANGYDMLTDDGGASLCTVMWGDTLGNHEYMRLPMLYLFAYEVSGDRHFLEKYKEIREEAYKKSLAMGKYWAMYALGQMQASLRLCYDVDDEDEWRLRYLELMNNVADYADGMTNEIRKKFEAQTGKYNLHQISFRDLERLPTERFSAMGYPKAIALKRPDSQAYFALQDCAQLVIITGLTPDRALNEKVKELFIDSFEQIDFLLHERNLPIYFLNGYYRTLFK
jgi:hypothetical protein